MKRLIVYSGAGRAAASSYSYAFILFLSLLKAIAQQPGDIDLTFGNPVQTLGDSSRFDGRINAMLRQPDGKILVVGNFAKYNGITKNRIARLNPNGNPDPGFLVASGFNGEVNCLAFGPNGQIYAGGLFTTIDAQPYTGLARLNADGTLDDAFSVGTGFDAAVSTIAVQSDGKVIVGGSFSSYNGTACKSIVRLNTNGSLDNSFVTGTGFNNYVSKAIIQTDGKIILGGNFTMYNGIVKNRIVRLAADGSIDPTFVLGTGFNAYVQCMAIQTDGKILVGGNFTSFAGSAASRICRLKSDGTLDTDFKAGTGLNAAPYDIALANGSVYLSGAFTAYNAAAAKFLVRLATSGEIDPTFSRKFGANVATSGGFISAMCLEPNGNFIIGGDFDDYDNVVRNNIAKVKTDGSIMRDFSVAYGFDNGTLGTVTNVRSLAVQPDGKILAGGSFSTYDGFRMKNLVRLLPNGKIDTSFYCNLGGFGVEDIKVDTVNKKIYIAGGFSSVNGISRNSIARLNMNGTLDNTFNIGEGFDGPVYKLALLPDGKVIAVGDFPTYDNTPSSMIARLNKNGSLDLTFTIGQGFDLRAFALDIQPDGKIIVGGYFPKFNGTDSKGIARLNANGTLDATFKPGTGFTYNNSTVYSVTVQEDGKILCSGSFNTYNGTSLTSGVARLNADGTIDAGFTPELTTTATLYTTLIFKSGAVLLPSSSSPFNIEISCVDEKGKPEPSFNAGTGFDEEVRVFALQGDEKALVGGRFTTYNGYTIYKLARIYGAGMPTDLNNASVFEADKWLLYPNPTSDLVNISLTQSLSAPAVFTLTNALGETVEQHEVAALQSSFELHQPAGTYYATLSNGKERLTRKILIQKK